jgi:hypothetical protein
MSMSVGEGESQEPSGSGTRFEVDFKIEVEAELTLVESSGAEQSAGLPISEWLFDPAEVQREAVGLRNLLDAAEELGSRHGLPGMDGRSERHR